MEYVFFKFLLMDVIGKIIFTRKMHKNEKEFIMAPPPKNSIIT